MLCYQCGSPVDSDVQTCPNCGADLSRTSRRIELPQGKTLERFTQQLKAVSRQDVPLFPQGEVLGERFVLGKVIGRGPYGQVFFATDRELEVDVAIKVLEPQWLLGHRALDAFERTLKNARKMTQKHIVRVHGHGVHKEHGWVSMQHLDGLSLRKLMKIRQGKDEAFEREEVDRIVSGLVAALGHIGKSHAHGDLKPENIIFLPDMLKVTDHFLAQSLSPAALIKAQPQSPYLAPELRDMGATLSRYTDIYSLGAIVSEVMFGQPEPPEDRDLGGDPVAREVAALCRIAMSQDPEDRPGSLEAFSEAFATAIDQEELNATSSLILTIGTPTPPPAPPTTSLADLSFKLPLNAPTEEEIATVEVGRSADGHLPVLGDLLPTNEVDRTVHPLPNAPFAPAHNRKEPTSTVAAPRPEASGALPPSAPKKPFPILPVVLAVGLFIAICALLVSNKPAEVTLGDDPAAPSSTPTPSNPEITPEMAQKELAVTTPTSPLAPDMAQEAREDTGRVEVAGEGSEPAAVMPGPLGVIEKPPEKALDVPTKPEPKPVAMAIKTPIKGPEPKADPEESKDGCPSGMVLLKSGPFCIDRYEYPGAGAMPKTKVSWFQAKKECESQTKRLCTRSEWVKACGGKYPWGSEWNAGKCNTQDEDGFERSLAASGSTKSCRSGSGAYDMVGNVFEWTAEKRIVGGSFSSDESVASCGYSSGKSPSSSSGEIGFRCCANPS